MATASLIKDLTPSSTYKNKRSCGVQHPPSVLPLCVCWQYEGRWSWLGRQVVKHSSYSKILTTTGLSYFSRALQWVSSLPFSCDCSIHRKLHSRSHQIQATVTHILIGFYFQSPTVCFLTCVFQNKAKIWWYLSIFIVLFLHIHQQEGCTSFHTSIPGQVISTTAFFLFFLINVFPNSLK